MTLILEVSTVQSLLCNYDPNGRTWQGLKGVFVSFI